MDASADFLAFLRGDKEAEGAFPRGTRIVKVRSESADPHRDGATGKVLSSWGPVTDEMLRDLALPPGSPAAPGDYAYMVSWDDDPWRTVFTIGSKLEPA